ncbi:MAG: ABC-2 type transport system permease protein [Candidatus Latescibacterota bacterium]
MSAYWAIFSARLRMLLQYRAAALAGLSTQLFWGLIRVMAFEAFYRSSAATIPMPVEQVVDYIWLGQAFLMLLPIRLDAEIRTMVRSGTIAYELVRPLDLYNFWYMRTIASCLAPTTLRCGPLLLIALLVFDMRLPPSSSAAFAFALTMVSALLLAAAISNLLNITLLWTVAGEGTAGIMQVVTFLFCGMIVPLPLFPDWMQPLLSYSPFAGLMDLPFRLYTGHISSDQLASVFARQLGWTLALVVFSRWLLARGTRILVAQGG